MSKLLAMKVWIILWGTGNIHTVGLRSTFEVVIKLFNSFEMSSKLCTHRNSHKYQPTTQISYQTRTPLLNLTQLSFLTNKKNYSPNLEIVCFATEVCYNRIHPHRLRISSSIPELLRATPKIDFWKLIMSVEFFGKQ